MEVEVVSGVRQIRSYITSSLESSFCTYVVYVVCHILFMTFGDSGRAIKKVQNCAICSNISICVNAAP